jgi:hypothetical protein
MNRIRTAGNKRKARAQPRRRKRSTSGAGKEAVRSATLGMTGSIAANLHEGSRSEYLAQFVFSSFGTAIPVPHQEDSGLDIYCTLLDQVGQRAWPRAYYSVQVKSTMDPWVFGSAESVRWLIEHPLPIFLCIVQKPEAVIRVYHTSPRFAAWSLPIQHRNRLELIPGTEMKGHAIEWGLGDTYKLEAPILKFTIQEVLDRDFRAKVKKVLKFWIDFDVENLFRINSGIHFFWTPHEYETNTTKIKGISGQGQRLLPRESLARSHTRLKELLGFVATHHYRNKDMVSAAIYAMALRQLFPDYSSPNPHDSELHTQLNNLFSVDHPSYQYQACDSLLKIVKNELARHGIAEQPPVRITPAVTTPAANTSASFRRKRSVLSRGGMRLSKN